VLTLLGYYYAHVETTPPLTGLDFPHAGAPLDRFDCGEPIASDHGVICSSGEELWTPIALDIRDESPDSSAASL